MFQVQFTKYAPLEKNQLHGITQHEVLSLFICLFVSMSLLLLLLLLLISGVVCVWDLETKLFRSPGSRLSSPSSHMMFHPVVQLPTQESSPCRCVSWCPSDQHYIFTGNPYTHPVAWQEKKGKKDCVLEH